MSGRPVKIGLYGGTFNPIHCGHVHILREFIRRLGLDRVLLIPTGQPPHKEAPELAGAEDRLAMCRLAAAEIAEAPVEVCTIELERPGKSYSAHTVALLKEQYPEDELYFLMGEDMFLTVQDWYHPEEIAKRCVLCASPRSVDGFEKLIEQKARLEEEFSAVCLLEDIPYLPVSSTQIRALAARGESVTGLAPPAVERYLAEHGLYRGTELTYEQCEAEVRKHLSDRRFFHSQCVAEKAAALAERYGADVEKARLAGILHDIMKDAPKEEQLKMLEEFGIILTDSQRENPKLWHAVCGEAYLRNVLGVKDEEVLSAVRLHTSGGKDMTLLEKVLFTADYISADREYPGVEIMRDAAERSLEEAMVRGVAWTLNDLSGQGLPIDPDSVYAYNDALRTLREGRSLIFRPGSYGFPEIETEKGENE